MTTAQAKSVGGLAEPAGDADVLRQCIPGCQSLEKTADDRLQAVVEIKIGPIGAEVTVKYNYTFRF